MLLLAVISEEKIKTGRELKQGSFD